MSTVVYKPLKDHVVLRLEPEPALSQIIGVVRSTEGLARFGTVASIGPEVRDIQVGQRVLASITAGVEIGEGVVMVSEQAVLGVQHT